MPRDKTVPRRRDLPQRVVVRFLTTPAPANAPQQHFTFERPVFVNLFRAERSSGVYMSSGAIVFTPSDKSVFVFGRDLRVAGQLRPAFVSTSTVAFYAADDVSIDVKSPADE